MQDYFTLYISAAGDLEDERAALGRALPHIPVTLGWRLHQSPLHNSPLDLNAVVAADIHALLLGGDIRAPIGLEWLAAQRASRPTHTYRKIGATPTLAATEFAHQVARTHAWHPFSTPADLVRQLLRVIADHLLSHPIHFALTPDNLTTLRDWRTTLDQSPTDHRPPTHETADSAIILTPERFRPRDGIVIDA